jgi:predicted nuclease of predicted toxin-antitoxin system
MWGCFADNHVPRALARALMRRGFNIATTQGRGLERADDEVVADTALAEQRLVLTNDTDFLRLSGEASLAGKVFPPVVFWPRHGRRKIEHLVAEITLRASELDYNAICNLIFYA